MSEPGGGDWPLDDRTGLPADFGWLTASFPRERWADVTVPATATHWLQMHDGFRHAAGQMNDHALAYRSGAVDLRSFHDQLLPTLSRFLQHLDGHHRVETGHYFPIFRRIEPRIAAGIDLLDRDHDAVHLHLEALAAGGNALHRSVRVNAPDAADHAARLADTIQASASPLLRHLDDEEDIVIPLIALTGDPHG